MQVEEGRSHANQGWMWNKIFHIVYHPRGCQVCTDYGHHLMEAKFTKDDEYTAVIDKRRRDIEYWRKKALKYVDDLDETDKHVCKLTARVKELKQELEDGHDYKER